MMFGYFGLFLLIFLSLVGICSLLSMLAEWLCGETDGRFTLIPLRKSTAELTLQLQSMLHWGRGRVILLELDADEATHAAAVRLQETCSNVALLCPETLSSYLAAERGRTVKEE